MTDQRDVTDRQWLLDYIKEFKQETNDKLKGIFKTLAELSQAVASQSEKNHTMVQVQDQYSETQAQLTDQFRRITRQLNKLSNQTKDAKTQAAQGLADVKDLKHMINKLVLIANKYRTEHATVKTDMRNQSIKIRRITKRIDDADTQIENSKVALKTLKWVGGTAVTVITLIGTLLAIYVTIFGPIAKATGKGP